MGLGEMRCIGLEANAMMPTLWILIWEEVQIIGEEEAMRRRTNGQKVLCCWMEVKMARMRASNVQQRREEVYAALLGHSLLW